MDLQPLTPEDKETINSIMQRQDFMDADEDVVSKMNMIQASLTCLVAALSLKKAKVRQIFVPPDNWKRGLEEEVVHELYRVWLRAADKSDLEVDWASFFYRPEFLVQKPKAKAPPIPLDVEQLQRAFDDTPYIGNANKAFYSCLTEMNLQFSEGIGTESYYGKFCSVAQSSGTGKTRLLTELPETRVLYINLRETHDMYNYPLRDDIPAEMLDASQRSETQFEQRCCAFFAAVFDTVEYELTNEVGKDLPAWRNALLPLNPTRRKKFFGSLKEQFDARLLQSVALEPESPTRPQRVAKITASASGSVIQHYDHPYLSGENGMLTAYEYLIGQHKDIFEKEGKKKNKPQLVIVLDEAAILREPIDVPNHQYLPSDVLCRAISRYSKCREAPIWVVFASTESKIAEFAAPSVNSNSLRLRRGGELLFPPFVEVGFDQHAPVDEVDMDNIASVEHLALFGRPLWRSLHDQGSLGLPHTAKAKLLGGVPFSTQSNNHGLVILSQRFGLSIVFNHPQSTKFIDKSVSSYMRICTSISDDRLWKFTTYPSEPLLSHAAAMLMWKSADVMAAMFDQLGTRIRDGMVDKGQSGELASRVCTLLAKDLCLRRRSVEHSMEDVDLRNGDSPRKSYSDSVPVIYWLKTLFGDRVVPAEHEAKITEAFEGWEINFSHWVCMDTNIGKYPEGFDPSDWTKCHYVRSSAVQCTHNQPAVDKMIPMRCGDHYSQIYIQDKNSKKLHKQLHLSIDRRNAGIQTDNGEPWIVILMDMGASSEETSLNVAVDMTNPEARDPKPIPFCWRINAAGKTERTYPFFAETDFPLGKIFDDLLTQEFQPSPREVVLRPQRDQFKFGSSTQNCHMKWRASAKV